MIRSILKMGDQRLLQRSEEVTAAKFNQLALFQLIEDLSDTQRHYGGVGIAAPQIGVNKRIIIIEYYQEQITRYSHIGDCPRLVLINPCLSFVPGVSATYPEGCLSLPGLRGQVTRPVAVSFEYFDQFGDFHHGEDAGFLARVLQHECDHLEGILYPMRMMDMSTLAFIDE